MHEHKGVAHVLTGIAAIALTAYLLKRLAKKRRVLLFDDDVQRTEVRPKREREPIYDYYNSSARRPIAALRGLLQSWFDAYPASGKKDLLARFRSRIAKARIKWFLGENTAIYGLGELSDLLTDPQITIGSVVDDLYAVRNYIAHGDRIPDRCMRDTLRDGFEGPVCVYAILFEAQSFIIRNSLLKILRDGLLSHFADARSAEAYFGTQGLTKDKLRSRP
jgi:hypothetical protein